MQQWHFSCGRWLLTGAVFLFPAALLCGCSHGPARGIEQISSSEPNVLTLCAGGSSDETLRQRMGPVDPDPPVAVRASEVDTEHAGPPLEPNDAERRWEGARPPERGTSEGSPNVMYRGWEPEPPHGPLPRPPAHGPRPLARALTDTVPTPSAMAVAVAASEAKPSARSSGPLPDVRDFLPAGPAEASCDATDPSAGAKTLYPPPVFVNGEDVLQLDLPEHLELIQLLDLVAEYLNLDYVCNLDALRGQTVSLRLHGKLRGEMRVKDLYSLLESVLTFKGYAMICRKDRLVTIVPVADALGADPELVHAGDGPLEAGNMIVTRLFAVQYVSTATVTELLEKMKLSVAVSVVEETQTLVVTGYAQRMARLEQLLNLVDRPGRPKEFRVRPLKYALVGAIIGKIETLATELQMAPVRIPAAPVRRGSPPPPALMDRDGLPREAGRLAGRALYLDADERTNRILMVGYAPELAVIENAIDALDLARQDPRTPKVYRIKRLHAADVLGKLQELGVLGAGAPAARSMPGRAYPEERLTASLPARDTNLAEQPQVTVIEPTNALLIHATEEQHVWIATLIDHIDATPKDLRILQVYDIKHMDASEVKKKLEEFEVIARTGRSGTPVVSAAPASTSMEFDSFGPVQEATPLQTQVVVLETTNSLLINAAEEQQRRIEELVGRIDVEVRREAIPYEIYFLENQEPDRLAEVLGKIIQETVKDKEGKIEKVIRKTDDQIVIVPDAATFSLIVYANRKNQDWISKLVTALDKRRPQVLIDVTLVEITKVEAFAYDLNWIQSFPDLLVTSGVTGSLIPSVPGEPGVRLPQDVTGTLAQSGRNRLIDVQSNSGNFRGFYGDRHINVLLQAMASKDYGRVLAKPKVLVNDNEPGTIKTADTTYVEIRSSVPVSTGNAGPDTTLIETSRKFESYEAGIELRITPHISEGDLLRLKIELSRSDFLQAGSLDRPPDKRANDLTTTVTVPDGSTIILGGLQKLNQNKSARKVPLLGDLPLVGGLFRGINNRDSQSNLYVFVKAEVIRPAGLAAQRMEDLEALSQRNRDAFEQHEQEFQKYQTWPGLKPKPVSPPRALDAR